MHDGLGPSACRHPHGEPERPRDSDASANPADNLPVKHIRHISRFTFPRSRYGRPLRGRMRDLPETQNDK